MKIHKKADLTVSIYDDFSCDICNRKLKSGERFRTFKNNDVDEFCDDKKLDRKYVFEVRHYHTIDNIYIINICEKCFKPKTYDENKSKFMKEARKNTIPRLKKAGFSIKVYDETLKEVCGKL